MSWLAPGPLISMLVRFGSALCRFMVPVALMLIVSFPTLLLASSMACLREPGPESLVLVTVKVLETV